MSIVTATRPALARHVDSRLRPSRSASLATTIDPIRVLRRHIRGILVSILVGGVVGVGAYFACRKVYPLYTAQVLFEVQPGLQQSTDLSTIDMTNDESVFRIAQTETFMLTSREVLRQALRHPDVKKTEWIKKYVEVNSDGSETINYDNAEDKLIKQVGPTVMRSSNLFGVHWSTHSSADLPIVLGAIQGAYTDMRKKRDSAIYDTNLGLFEDRLQRTERNLLDIQQEIKKLIKDANLMTLEDTRYSPEMFKEQTFTQQRADSTARLNAATTAYRISSAKLEGTMLPTADDYLEAERDPILQEQMVTVNRVSAEVRRLTEERRPDDPMLMRSKSVLQAVEQQLEQNKNDIIKRNLEGREKILAENIEQFRAVVEAQDDELEKSSTVLKDQAVSQSEYDTKKIERDHLEEQRKQEMQLIQEVQLMRLRADASRVRPALRAQEPRQMSFPKPEVIIPLGVLVVMGLTVGMIFLRELMDQRVKSASDLAVLPGAFVLGGIPELEEDPTPGKTASAELVVRKQPFSVLAESYRQSYTAINTAVERAGHQTVLLVGGLPGTGTTTAATNLAAAAAATGKKVLAIDANFRRPRLAQAMEINGDGPGLGDLLSGAATLDETIVDAGGGISVIPAGTPANRVIERLNNGLFDSLVAELRGKFDLIIFDAPPAVVAGDAMVLANRVDAAVLVVRAHQEHRGLVARMINQLSDARCELLGVLLNRPRGTAGGYFKKNYATMAQYATTNGQA